MSECTGPGTGPLEVPPGGPSPRPAAGRYPEGGGRAATAAAAALAVAAAALAVAVAPLALLAAALTAATAAAAVVLTAAVLALTALATLVAAAEMVVLAAVVAAVLLPEMVLMVAEMLEIEADTAMLRAGDTHVGQLCSLLSAIMAEKTTNKVQRQSTDKYGQVRTIQRKCREKTVSFAPRNMERKSTSSQMDRTRTHGVHWSFFL